MICIVLASEYITLSLSYFLSFLRSLIYLSTAFMSTYSTRKSVFRLENDDEKCRTQKKKLLSNLIGCRKSVAQLA